MIEPDTQNNPSPNCAPTSEFPGAVPWKNTSGAPAPVCAVDSCNVSAPTTKFPLVDRRADSASELPQPAPLAPMLPHGHGVALPSPAQNTRVPLHETRVIWMSSIAA